jgi:hypothetical protein
VAVSRGELQLDVTVLDRETGDPDVVTIARRDFIETLERNAQGTEQSWRFEQAPGGAGNLVIAVATPGLQYIGATSAGLQLRRPGVFELRYSHGIWIDALGKRTAIPARFDAGRILLAVPAAVVAGSAFPAVLDPEVVVDPR